MPQTADLDLQFRDPPSARPRVWWHWMNGNVTKDGIAKDIDWMSRMGIGGLQAFDANLMTPQVVDHRLVFMSPEWKDAFRFAAQSADAQRAGTGHCLLAGLERNRRPWVKPADGLKKLVWSETVVRRAKPLQGQALRAARNHRPVSGHARRLALTTSPADTSRRPRPISTATSPCWPCRWRSMPPPRPRPPLMASGRCRLLTDDNLTAGVSVPRGKDIRAASPIPMTRPRPCAAPRLCAGRQGHVPGPTVDPLEASDDGKTWREWPIVPSPRPDQRELARSRQPVPRRAGAHALDLGQYGRGTGRGNPRSV
jgi:hypothetical protein